MNLLSPLNPLNPVWSVYDTPTTREQPKQMATQGTQTPASLPNQETKTHQGVPVFELKMPHQPNSMTGIDLLLILATVVAGGVISFLISWKFKLGNYMDDFI